MCRESPTICAALHGIACFYDVGFGARAVSRKTPIYFIYKGYLMYRISWSLAQTPDYLETWHEWVSEVTVTRKEVGSTQFAQGPKLQNVTDVTDYGGYIRAKNICRLGLKIWTGIWQKHSCKFSVKKTCPIWLSCQHLSSKYIIVS